MLSNLSDDILVIEIYLVDIASEHQLDTVSSILYDIESYLNDECRWYPFVIKQHAGLDYYDTDHATY